MKLVDKPLTKQEKWALVGLGFVLMLVICMLAPFVGYVAHGTIHF